MFKVPLVANPNQSVSFNVDGAYWRLHVYQAIERMYADLSRNGVVVVQGARCLVGAGVMAYDYMHRGFGNFIFDSDADWTNFDGTCNLYYLTSDEMAEYQKLEEESYANVYDQGE